MGFPASGRRGAAARLVGGRGREVGPREHPVRGWWRADPSARVYHHLADRRSEDVRGELAIALEARKLEMIEEIFRGLGAWDRVRVARHPSRPTCAEYLGTVFEDVVEVHGDRRFGRRPPDSCPGRQCPQGRCHRRYRGIG